MSAMYERSYGYRYAEVDGSAAEIAKRIRADIKQAVSEGLLPARWRYSVRSDRFSGGQAIDIIVKDCADAWKDCDRRPCPNAWCASGGMHRDLPAASAHEILTDEAEAAEMTLKRIHGAYNHDGSDSQTDYFDVRYYGQVTFRDARSADFDRREKARLAAAKQAREQATDRRVVRVYGRAGRTTTHLAVDVDGRTRLVCGATLWQSSVVGAADGAAVTCSRCAKKVT